jgi:hypothetical protein
MRTGKCEEAFHAPMVGLHAVNVNVVIVLLGFTTSFSFHSFCDKIMGTYSATEILVQHCPTKQNMMRDSLSELAP